MIYITDLFKNILIQYTVFDLVKLLFISFVLKTLFNIYKVFIRERKKLKEIYGKESWCLVTGATDGIGKAFCFELAKEGFNIILVSRTLTKLTKVSEEIKASYPNVKTNCIQFDFYKNTNFEEYKNIFASLPDSFDISILVNNVGTDHHDSFEKLSLYDISQEITLNIFPQAYLTKIFWDKLNSRKETKSVRSGIINVSSFVADFPFPMKAIYAATKAYDHYMTIGLANELKDSNVDFLSVKPLEVATPLTGTKPDGIFIITPEQCAAASLNDFGYEGETYSAWGHKLQAFIVNLLPRFAVYWFMRNYWYMLVPNPHANESGNTESKKEN